MSSKEKMLAAVKASRPSLLPMPVFDWSVDGGNLTETFIKTLQAIGGTVTVIKDIIEVKNYVISIHGDQKRIMNIVETLDWKYQGEYINETAASMEKIEVTIIEGELGVAENGAIWIPESSMGNRALPFICQHLVIVLSARNIVPTMHYAYPKIDVIGNGFGVFIAGPSKTADIEQSLVVGAHGARSLKVFLLEN